MDLRLRAVRAQRKHIQNHAACAPCLTNPCAVSGSYTKRTIIPTKARLMLYIVHFSSFPFLPSEFQQRDNRHYWYFQEKVLSPREINQAVLTHFPLLKNPSKIPSVFVGTAVLKSLNTKKRHTSDLSRI